jgi:hypothetical protein
MQRTPDRSRRYFVLPALLYIALLAPLAQLHAQESTDQPLYVRGDSGWVGLFGHGADYARFMSPGTDAQFQDATHMIVSPGVGLMISFVATSELAGADRLRAHAQWEADYWREHAASVDTVTRRDLSGARTDVRVTQLTVHNAAGQRLAMYIIGERTADGVFAYAFSPADEAGDEMVRRFVESVTLVHRPLTAAELERVSASIRRRRRTP